MYYFEVLVASLQYHGSEALTYTAETMLAPGTIVRVPLRMQKVLGIVVQETPKPDFVVKPIAQVLPIKPLPPQTFEFISWISSYYPAPLGVIVQSFLPTALLNKHIEASLTPFVPSPITPKLPPLTEEQKIAIQKIRTPGIFLLHGETGSGKTRVYTELAAQVLEAKQSAIILTPEIGLTSQLANEFRTRFGEQVVVMHSQLTEVARQKAWLRIAQSKQPLVVIGPRSALFSPLSHIGLIVVDEVHENAYKQEQAPHYHAARAAAKRGQLYNSIVVLGSATPPVVDYFLAEKKQRPIIRMQQLARGKTAHQTHVSIVDLKDRAQFSKSPHLSKKLVAAIEQTLAKNEQVLLFLNRRGTARMVFCEKCGWQAACPRCDLPLVYHGDDHTMRCHTCGFQRATVSSCPECKNPSVIFKTVGTKAIVAEVANLFPQANVQRFDTDNKRGERIEQHFEAVKSGAVDIIVGTQTLAKGLDLPRLGLVGVIMADTTLYLPDYNSEERTYQLLAQVIGRVGRGHRDSQAIIQTYMPESPLLRAILQKDWYSFYQKELAERKAFLFPPYCYILKLWCRRASSDTAKKAAEQLASNLQKLGRRVVVEGPAPSFHEKVVGKYQWQLICKAKDRAELLAIISALPSGWSYDIDPANLL
ncbi:MAG TPA: primosomal protein N' [Candidatus Saccharimonadales bacterium]|nr:primosomal protein N' [Candidatus Saccharimonadales bacterium]